MSNFYPPESSLGNIAKFLQSKITSEYFMLNWLQDPPSIHVYDPLHPTEESPIPKRRHGSGTKTKIRLTRQV